jgi:two-component system alkaline phosphatase synthesis response regulator PhoP
MKPTANGQLVRTSKLNRFSFIHGMIELDRAEIIHRDGQKCRLSPREVELLTYLLQRLGIPVSRDELLTRLWKMDPTRTFTRTIDVHIGKLRRKLGDNARRPALLLSVSGYGYMFAKDACRREN